MTTRSTPKKHRIDRLERWLMRHLRQRRVLRHVGRRPLQDKLSGRGPAQAVPADIRPRTHAGRARRP